MLLPLIFALTTTSAHARDAIVPPKLTKIQTLRLRVKRAWARVLLTEMDKNDFLLRGVGTGEGPSPQNLLIASVNTVPAVTLAVVTKRLFDKEWARVKGHLAQVRRLKSQINTGLTGVEANARLIAGGPHAGDVRAELRALRNPGAGAYVRDFARDVTLIGFGALTAALIYDGIQVWIQVAMTPDAYEKRRAELQDFVDRADYALMQNDAR